MSIRGGMVEWIVVYWNAGILDNKENKPMWTSSDMDEFYKYVEWQQQDTKEQWFHGNGSNRQKSKPVMWTSGC